MFHFMRRTRLSCEILRRAQFVLIMKVGEVDKCDAKTFALLRIKYLEEAPATIGALLILVQIQHYTQYVESQN